MQEERHKGYFCVCGSHTYAIWRGRRFVYYFPFSLWVPYVTHITDLTVSRWNNPFYFSFSWWVPCVTDITLLTVTQRLRRYLTKSFPSSAYNTSLAFLSIRTFMVGPGVTTMVVATYRMIFLVIRIGSRLANLVSS